MVALLTLLVSASSGGFGWVTWTRFCRKEER